MKSNSAFTADDARRLAQNLLASEPYRGSSLDAAVWHILVEFADLYVRLLDPADQIPIGQQAIFPGLRENLEMCRRYRLSEDEENSFTGG